MIAALLFYVFAITLVGSALAVVILRNPVHSVLFLILAFFNAAALFVMLGAEFLAMLLVIVYVGAVAVLFLFVVMMLNVDVESFRRGLTKYSTIGFFVAAFLLVQMITLFTNMDRIAQMPLRLTSPVNGGITNTESLGRIIYTDYALAFQTSGMILLVAMIGAIVLCFYPRERMRKQNINAQVARKRRNTLEIRHVETGKGVS
jgi:NADH-quinone oxidoreductase subunit J